MKISSTSLNTSDLLFGNLYPTTKELCLIEDSELFEFNEISKIYLSSEGVYNKINPNTLYDKSLNSFVIDKYEVIHVDNLKDIIHLKNNSKSTEFDENLNAVLIGNPTFFIKNSNVDCLLYPLLVLK